MPMERTCAWCRCRGCLAGCCRTVQGRLALSTACPKHSWKTNNSFFFPCTNSRSSVTLRLFNPTMQDFSLLFIFQNFTHSQALLVKGNRVPAVHPLANSLNNCTPSKISLHVCFMPTDLQIISLQLVKENLQITCFVLEKI